MKILTALALSAILLLAGLTTGCVPASIAITALASAPAVVQNLNIPQADKDRYSHGFTGLSKSIQKFDRSDRGTAAKIALATEVSQIVLHDFAKNGDPKVQAWIDSILLIVYSFAGIQPPSDGAVRDIAPSVQPKITKEAAERLKRTIEAGPEK